MKKLMCAVLLGAAAAPALAGVSPLVTTNVTQLMTDSVNYGGCMAKLSINPAGMANVSCNADWVSFGCTGEYVSKDVATRMFTAAQLAMVTGNKIKIRVTDSKTYNGGYCTVQRVDNNDS